MVGIGLISSDYISPDDDDNPCAEIPYQNVRMVDWLINEPITLDTNIFAQSTVTPLDIKRWLQIKQVYLSAYPNMENTFTQLEEGLDIEELKEQKVKLNPAEVPSELKPLMEISERTSNILLYGPPGTGKTWLVNHFTNYYLLYHNASLAEANEYWQSKDSDRNSAVNLQVNVRAQTDNKEITESFITELADKKD